MYLYGFCDGWMYHFKACLSSFFPSFFILGFIPCLILIIRDVFAVFRLLSLRQMRSPHVSTVGTCMQCFCRAPSVQPRQDPYSTWFVHIEPNMPLFIAGVNEWVITYIRNRFLCGMFLSPPLTITTVVFSETFSFQFHILFFSLSLQI